LGKVMALHMENEHLLLKSKCFIFHIVSKEIQFLSLLIIEKMS